MDEIAQIQRVILIKLIKLGKTIHPPLINQPFMLIYADVCCLNRPLDDLQQPRVRLEAILTILQKCEAKTWSLISSDALRFEIAKNTNPDKRNQLEAVLSLTTKLTGRR